MKTKPPVGVRMWVKHFHPTETPIHGWVVDTPPSVSTLDSLVWMRPDNPEHHSGDGDDSLGGCWHTNQTTIGADGENEVYPLT